MLLPCPRVVLKFSIKLERDSGFAYGRPPHSVLRSVGIVVKKGTGLLWISASVNGVKSSRPVEVCKTLAS